MQPNEARFEYVNLMRWRLEKHLGYRRTHSFDVRNTKRAIYSMIFATDHPAGNGIMGDVYTKAARMFPQMIEEAKERQASQRRLFAIPATVAEYRHEPPLPPFGSNDRQV